MDYKKIKPKKIYEVVAETIHEMIRSGKLKPGDRLDSVEQLAKNFRVGRAAVREALSALKAMGLIEIKQGEGTFVKGHDLSKVIFPLSTSLILNKDDVVHLLQVRKIFETGAAALAAKMRTEDDLLAISHALERMKAATGEDELGEKADFQFHIAISRATKNPLLCNVMDNVAEIMFQAQKETRKVWIYSKRTTLERLYEEHREIYLAILEQDEERARQAMNTHLQNVEEILNSYLQATIS